MIILLWVKICRSRQPHIGLDIHNLAPLKSEKSELRHTGLPPRKKAILVGATPAGVGQSAGCRNTINKCATGTRQSHELPWLCRCPVGRSSVRSIDASTSLAVG